MPVKLRYTVIPIRYLLGMRTFLEMSDPCISRTALATVLSVRTGACARRLITTGAALVFLAFFAPTLVAQELEIDPVLRKQRLEALVQVVSGLEIWGDVNEDVLQASEPLLRYNNPNRSRFNDGAMFVLSEDDGRARALVAVSIRKTGDLFLEVVSVSGQSLTARLDGFGQWSPPAGGSGPQISALQPPAFQPATRRLLAMRQIARSFTFEFQTKEWTEARLLTQPFYRFSAPKQGIIDGAIFGYAESNDPEAALMVWLEQGAEKEPPKWYWLAAASTSLPLRCFEDGMPRWEKGNYWQTPRSAAAPYIEFRQSQHPELVPPTE